MIASGDAGHGQVLLRDAEQIARSITNPDRQARVLRAVAETVALYDPNRAEQVVGGITDPYHRHEQYTVTNLVGQRAAHLIAQQL